MGSKLKLIKGDKNKVIKFDDAKINEITKKQFDVGGKFRESACKIESYGVAILDDVRTGATIAVANTKDVEIIAEMLASFTTTFAVENNIPFEDFLDIYFGHFEKFMKQIEGAKSAEKINYGTESD